MEGLKRVGKLGEGVSGHVFVVLADDNQLIAVKRIKQDPSCSAERTRSCAEWEIKCWKQVSSHPNVVRLIDVTRTAQDIIMSMECVKHDLRGLLESTRSRTFTKSTVKGFIVQLLTAVSHCHASNVLHCDLKPENVLYSADGVLKLCDFGLARFRFQNPITPQAYSLWYRAPERPINKLLYIK